MLMSLRFCKLSLRQNLHRIDALRIHVDPKRRFWRKPCNVQR